MAKKERDDSGKALLVLYQKEGQAPWCIYFGGEDEANKDSALMARDGYQECGRIWVEEKTKYVKWIE